MRIIALATEAKVYEVMRGKKTDIISNRYKKMGTVQIGETREGQAVLDKTGRRKALPKVHEDPTIMTKFFNMSIRPEDSLTFDDKAIVNIAKDIDGTVSKLLSAGGIFTDLFKELKNSKSKFLLTVIVEDNNNLDSMMTLDNRRGYFTEQSDMQVGKSSSNTKTIDLPQIVIKVSYDKTGRPLLSPKEQKHTLIHELMHHFDLIFSSKNANVKKLVKALRNHPIYTSRYSHKNDEEMIAELLSYYFLKKDYSEYDEQYSQLEDLATSIKVKVKRQL